MNITLTRKTNSGGKILEPGTLLDLPEGKARKLIDLGIARQVDTLSVGSWVKLTPPGDRIGQIVTCHEGEAVVRIFNGYGHQDMRIPLSDLPPTEAPERPLLPIPTYRVGDRVEYSHKEALNVRTGVVVETRIFPSSTWYRLRDGDSLRWVSEAHIQKRL